MTEMLLERARTMRKFSTEHEERLWYFLRNRRINGHKFIRQFVIKPYIVDFVCRPKKLIIEADGSQHLKNKEYDEERTVYLNAQGYRILRFWNHEVQKNIKEVLEVIRSALEMDLTLRMPSPVPTSLSAQPVHPLPHKCGRGDLDLWVIDR